MFGEASAHDSSPISNCRRSKSAVFLSRNINYNINSLLRLCVRMHIIYIYNPLRTVISASFSPEIWVILLNPDYLREDGDFNIDKWASFGSCVPPFISHNLVVIVTTILRNNSRKSQSTSLLFCLLINLPPYVPNQDRFGNQQRYLIRTTQGLQEFQSKNERYCKDYNNFNLRIQDTIR